MSGFIRALLSCKKKQHTRWAPLQGQAVGCFGLTEPSHGSNPSSMETTAKDDGEGHILLNGEKTWITNSPIADVAIVWAKYHEEIRGFIVPTKNTDGVSTPILQKQDVIEIITDWFNSYGECSIDTFRKSFTQGCWTERAFTMFTPCKKQSWVGSIRCSSRLL